MNRAVEEREREVDEGARDRGVDGLRERRLTPLTTAEAITNDAVAAIRAGERDDREVCAREKPAATALRNAARQADHSARLPVLAVELQRLGHELPDGARDRRQRRRQGRSTSGSGGAPCETVAPIRQAVAKWGVSQRFVEMNVSADADYSDRHST